MVAPLHRIIIFVGDVRKCARFYQDAFGFAALPSQHADAEWMELETGGCGLAFHKAHGPNGAIDSATGSAMAGSAMAGSAMAGSAMHRHKIVFYAEDVESARAAVVARGAVMGDVRKSGDLVLCDGKDPEGHVFQISNRN